MSQHRSHSHFIQNRLLQLSLVCHWQKTSQSSSSCSKQMCPANSTTTQSYSFHSSPRVPPLAPSRRGFFSSSLSRLSKLFILVLLAICLHIFNLVSTKLNTVSVLIWPLHLRSLVPKNKWAIVPFLWLGLIFGFGCQAVSVLSIIWTGSKTNLNLIFFLDSSKRFEHIVKGPI